MKYSLALITLLTIMLAACSPQELFSNVAVSDVERSAAESIDQAEALNEKVALIEAKRDAFPESAEFGLVQADFDGAAFVFRNDYRLDNKSLIEVEAIMPDANGKFYEVWLVGDTPADQINLGALTYNGPENYSLSHETNQDLSSYNTVVISREATPDDTIEERIMIAQFEVEAAIDSEAEVQEQTADPE